MHRVTETKKDEYQIISVLIVLSIKTHTHTHTYKYDCDIISAMDDLLTSGIQALERLWKKCMNHNEGRDHVEK